MSHRTAAVALIPVLVAFAAVADRAAAQAAGATAATAGAATRAPADHRADEQAIRALSQRWLAAARSRDVDGIMAAFASDAAAVYGGRLLTGAGAIRAQQEADIAAFAKERPGYTPSWETTGVEVAQGGDMAFESGTFDDSWNGGKGRERGHYLTVWRKVGGEWKVARDVAVPEAQPRAAAKAAP